MKALTTYIEAEIIAVIICMVLEMAVDIRDCLMKFLYSKLKNERQGKQYDLSQVVRAETRN